MPACLQCNNEFPEAPRRGARPQTYCNPKCQIKAANERRSIKRRGNLSTGGEVSGRPVASDPMRIPPRAKTPPSDLPSDRLNELIEKAHSRTGVNAFEIATIAKLRGISAWAPLRVILAP